jgi:hypothetical protein
MLLQIGFISRCISVLFQSFSHDFLEISYALNNIIIMFFKVPRESIGDCDPYGLPFPRCEEVYGAPVHCPAGHDLGDILMSGMGRTDRFSRKKSVWILSKSAEFSWILSKKSVCTNPICFLRFGSAAQQIIICVDLQ